MTTVSLVTGFLGAGKTTFITHYAKWLKLRGKSFAIIENEFGRAGADSAIFVDMQFPVAEIAGGCICCTLKPNFTATLTTLAKTFDHIIVEPSGIFAMDDFFDVMNSPDVKKCCKTGFVITIVNPKSLNEITGDSALVLSSQLHSTGMVVLSMTEGLSQNEIIASCEKITDISNISKQSTDNELVFKTSEWKDFTEEDFYDIENSDPKYTDHKFLPVNHNMIFFSIGVKPKRTFSHKDISDKIFELMNGDYGDILRIKGGVTSENGSIFSVNATLSGITISEIKEGPDFINVIGKSFDRKRINDMMNT